MEKLTKILILVIIVLVAGLSLCVGFLLGNYLNQPLKIVNNTTNSINSSSQNNQTNQVASLLYINYFFMFKEVYFGLQLQ